MIPVRALGRIGLALSACTGSLDGIARAAAPPAAPSRPMEAGTTRDALFAGPVRGSAYEVAPVPAGRRSVLAQADGIAPGVPLGPDDPAWAAGRWVGTAECRSRTYTIKLVLPERSTGMAALLDYTFVSPATGERGAGSIRYVLRASRGYRLDAAQVVAGEPWHPFAQLVIAAGHDGAPWLRSSGCGRLPNLRNEAPRQARAPQPGAAPARQAEPRRRGPAAAPPPSDVAASTNRAIPAQAPRRDPLFGEWSGALTCARLAGNPSTLQPGSQIALWFGDNAPGAVSTWQRRSAVSEDGPPRIAATLTEFVTGGRDGRASRQDYIGETLPDQDAYRFARISSGGMIGDAVIRNFVVRLNGDRSGLAGAIEGERCTAFTAARREPAAAAHRPAVAPPQGGGPFQRASSARDRCDALLAWMAPIAADFSTSDYYAGRLNAALPFMDDLFVPVFGQTFESTTPDYGQQIGQAILECSRDPLLRSRFDLIRQVSHALNDKSSALYAHEEARRNRVVHAGVRSARAEARRTDDPTAAIARLEAARVSFDSAKVVMARTVKARVVSELDAEISALAETVVAGIERRLPGERPIEQLTILSRARAFEAPPFRQLLPDARARLLTRLGPVEATAAATIFSELKQRDTGLPRNVAGLADLDGSDARRALSLLSPPARARYDAEWTGARAALMTAALSTEWNQAASAARTREGLAEGAAWIESFKTRWSAYLTEAPVSGLVGRFFTDRSKRLSTLADELRQQGSARSPIRASQILSLPEDKRNPIALEYDLIAAGL